MSAEQEQKAVAGFVGETGKVFTVPDEITPPINPDEIPKEIKDNVVGRKAAEDALDFIREQCAEQLGPRFWEVIRDSAIAEVGFPLNVSVGKPMDDTRAKTFLEESVPYGKYTGMKVKTVLKKDRAYLQNLVTHPDRFQKTLGRFFAWESAKQQPKTAAPS